MLGQLLHSINPVRRATTARNPPSLDSVTEDEHTKGLIFPGHDLLHNPDSVARTFPSADFDNAPKGGLATDSSSADIDLEYPRDIRILIAQGESSSLQELLLFDSKQPGLSESPRTRQPKHTRSDTSPQNQPRQLGRVSTIPAILEDGDRQRVTALSGTGGAFTQRSRLRKASVSSLPEEPVTLRQKESDEIVKIALDCMFENASSSYKGTSNKIHIVPLEPKPYDRAICSTSLSNDFTTTGQSKYNTGFARRPSSLSKSYAPGDEFLQAPRISAALNANNNRRRTVLITRTFSVSWSEEEEMGEANFPVEQQNGKPATLQDKQSNGRGQSDFTPVPQSPIQPSRPRTYRSPMYAITAVLHLPVSASDSPPPSRFGGPAARRIGSHASLGSSWESDRRSGWAMVDPMFGIESLAAHSIASDVDDRVDLIGQHWDIISRTLTTLQYLVQKKLLDMLKPLAKLRRGIKLLHMALTLDADVRRAAEDACYRILRGIKIQRVITGQGRWAIWREEARWLGQWAGGRDENFFFFNLITAFLGTHTDWISTLAPRSYRERYREQQRLNPTENLSVPSRTVIVSPDKMAARRLIFLLSSFLPANHPLGGRGDTSPLRPSTATSIRAYSQSPPTSAPISRQESLRRTINRRGKAARQRSRQQGSRGSIASFVLDIPDDRTETGTIRGPEGEGRPRRPSDTRSIIKKSLSMTESDSATRKSSATTGPTMSPSPAMPVPYFAYNRQGSFGAVTTHHRRPGSRESTASVNLINTLQRHNSGNASSESGSKWGSLKSLWSMGTRRGSSTEYSDILQNTDEGLGIMGVRRPEQTRSRLQQMTDEGEDLGLEGERSRDPDRTPEQAHLFTPELGPMSPTADSSTTKPIDLPIKTSVNPDDGVIDVQIPFLEWGSPLQSPPLPDYNSSSSWGESSFHSSIVLQSHRENEHPINVAGWLDKLHPDFALQAIKPYDDLVKDIKAAMSAEPNPPSLAALSSGQGPAETWVDICTTLVADTRNFTIKRLRLRRLVKVVRQPSSTVVTPPQYTSPLRIHHNNPYLQQAQYYPAPVTSEMILEERFDEEKIMDFDGALVDAIERLLGASGASSKAQSQSSSRSSSRLGRTVRDHQPGEDRTAEDHAHISSAHGDSQEVSRYDCKRFVLGALEQVVRSIARERKEARAKGERLRSVDEPDSTLKEGIIKWFEDVERNKIGESARDHPGTAPPAATSSGSLGPAVGVRSRPAASDDVFSSPPQPARSKA